MTPDFAACFVASLISFSTLVSSVEEHYLFSLSQGVAPSIPAGLWGGLININDHGQSQDLYQYGFNTPEENPSQSSPPKQRQVSYDPINKDVLFVTEFMDTRGVSCKNLTGFVAPLCPANTAEERILFSACHGIDSRHSHLFDGDCGEKCGLGPFAYHGGHTYFILSGIFGRSERKLAHRIELRQLTPCTRGESDLSISNILRCSRVLSVLHRAPYEKTQAQIDVWPTQTLRAISINTQLTFFHQLINTESENPALVLMKMIPEANVTSVLYSTNIDPRYAATNLNLQGFGSVDYRQGFLCWSAGSILLCGRNTEDTPLDAAAILSTGDANNASVCSGSLPVPELERLITGVAIADARLSLTIYFGCYAEVSGVGGLGLVSIRNSQPTKSIHSVTSDNTKVYGGSIFLSENVRSDCSALYTTRAIETKTASLVTEQSIETSASGKGISVTTDPLETFAPTAESQVPDSAGRVELSVLMIVLLIATHMCLRVNAI